MHIIFLFLSPYYYCSASLSATATSIAKTIMISMTTKIIFMTTNLLISSNYYSYCFCDSSFHRCYCPISHYLLQTHTATWTITHIVSLVFQSSRCTIDLDMIRFSSDQKNHSIMTSASPALHHNSLS